jgi:hypothetical protein
LTPFGFRCRNYLPKLLRNLRIKNLRTMIVTFNSSVNTNNYITIQLTVKFFHAVT